MKKKKKKNDRAPSEDSNQPGHPPSLIRVFACTQWGAKDPSFHHADSEDSDQTERLSRLVCVLAGCTVILLVLPRGGSNVLSPVSHAKIHVVYARIQLFNKQ